jgi:cell division protein FtsI (penicillin-binding protein 3)
MVKPMFVKEIREKGKSIMKFDPVVLNPQIVKPETVRKAKQLLEGVVQYGTAKNLRSSVYPIAGKTGTAQIAKGHGYGKDQNSVTYQASFVGYFPADKPKYSCIVIVNAPSGDVYYGGLVAGPIFKQIADRVFATELDIHQPVNLHGASAAQLPVIRNGSARETFLAARGLMVDLGPSASNGPYVHVSADSVKLHVNGVDPDRKLQSGIMPDLHGMTGEDAMYILENRGYRVRLKGYGAVKDQSVNPGEKIAKGTEVIIELAL